MFDRLDDLLIRYEELLEELNSPDVAMVQNRSRKPGSGKRYKSFPQADEGAVGSGSDCGGI